MLLPSFTIGEFLFAPPKLLSTLPHVYKKKFLNYLLFSLHTSPPPSPKHLLSGTILFSLPNTAPSLPPSSEPSPHSSAPALFRCPFSALRHRPSSTPSAPLPSGTVRSNRTEQRPSVRSYLAERCQKKEGRWGPERASAEKLKGRWERAGAEWEGDGKEGGGAGKGKGGNAGKETERRWAQRKEAVSERRRRGDRPKGGGALLGRGGDGGSAPEGGEEETGAGVWREKGRVV